MRPRYAGNEYERCLKPSLPMLLHFGRFVTIQGTAKRRIGCDQ
jgi:hypothetical protein